MSMDNDQWDVIKISVWSDSGRVIVYPGLKNSMDRDDEQACCQLFIQALFDFFEEVRDKLAESAIDDEEFDDRVSAEERRYAEKLIESFNSVRPPIGTIEKKMDLAFFSSDEPEPFLKYAG